MAHKRKSLSLSTKMELTELMESGTKNVKLVEKFQMSKSSVPTIWSQREKLREKWLKVGGHSCAKQFRLSTHEEMEAALITWFTQQRSKSIPISGPLLLEKAKLFATRFDETDFKASNGFMDRFKKRHGLCFKVVNGELAASDDVSSENFTKIILLTYFSCYSPKDVFNVDETALLYQLHPGKTMRFAWVARNQNSV